MKVMEVVNHVGVGQGGAISRIAMPLILPFSG